MSFNLFHLDTYLKNSIELEIFFNTFKLEWIMVFGDQIHTMMKTFPVSRPNITHIIMLSINQSITRLKFWSKKYFILYFCVSNIPIVSCFNKLIARYALCRYLFNLIYFFLFTEVLNKINIKTLHYIYIRTIMLTMR